MTSDPSIIRVDSETEALLRELREPTEVYNDVIKRLARFYRAALEVTK